MQYAMVAKLIMQKGVENVNVPQNISHQAFSEAGMLLFKERRYQEAGKALAKANNTHELLAAAEWLSRQGRFPDAAHFLIHTDDNDKMEACALACLTQDHEAEAQMLFQKTGNSAMLTFIQENLL